MSQVQGNWDFPGVRKPLGYVFNNIDDGKLNKIDKFLCKKI